MGIRSFGTGEDLSPQALDARISSQFVPHRVGKKPGIHNPTVDRSGKSIYCALVVAQPKIDPGQAVPAPALFFFRAPVDLVQNGGRVPSASRTGVAVGQPAQPGAKRSWPHVA